MNDLLELIRRGVDELLGRASGPLHLRLFIMPTVVTVLAIRAGLRHAREGRPPFLIALLANPIERPYLIRSALRDVGRVFVIAIVLDTIYQLWVLKAFHVGQSLIVAFVCAIVPYIVVRGPAGLLARRLQKRKELAADSKASTGV
jgi:hypothetical protein